MNEKMESNRQQLWPHVNGAAHHSLPPIAAITSCRPTATHSTVNQTAHHTSLPPIAAITSHRPPTTAKPILQRDQSPSTSYHQHQYGNRSDQINTSEPQTLTRTEYRREVSSNVEPLQEKPAIRQGTGPPPPSMSPTTFPKPNDGHIFLPPNPPRMTQAVTRPPTPFPEHPPHSHGLLPNVPPPLRASPVLVKSAFAAVQQHPREGVSSSSNVLGDTEKPPSPYRFIPINSAPNSDRGTPSSVHSNPSESTIPTPAPPSPSSHGTSQVNNHPIQRLSQSPSNPQRSPSHSNPQPHTLPQLMRQRNGQYSPHMAPDSCPPPPSNTHSTSNDGKNNDPEPPKPSALNAPQTFSNRSWSYTQPQSQPYHQHSPQLPPVNQIKETTISHSSIIATPSSTYTQPQTHQPTRQYTLPASSNSSNSPLPKLSPNNKPQPASPHYTYPNMLPHHHPSQMSSNPKTLGRSYPNDSNPPQSVWHPTNSSFVPPNHSSSSPSQVPAPRDFPQPSRSTNAPSPAAKQQIPVSYHPQPRQPYPPDKPSEPPRMHPNSSPYQPPHHPAPTSSHYQPHHAAAPNSSPYQPHHSSSSSPYHNIRDEKPQTHHNLSNTRLDPTHHLPPTTSRHLPYQVSSSVHHGTYNSSITSQAQHSPATSTSHHHSTPDSSAKKLAHPAYDNRISYPTSSMAPSHHPSFEKLRVSAHPSDPKTNILPPSSHYDKLPTTHTPSVSLRAQPSQGLQPSYSPHPATGPPHLISDPYRTPPNPHQPPAQSPLTSFTRHIPNSSNNSSSPLGPSSSEKRYNHSYISHPPYQYPVPSSASKPSSTIPQGLREPSHSSPASNHQSVAHPPYSRPSVVPLTSEHFQRDNMRQATQWNPPYSGTTNKPLPHHVEDRNRYPKMNPMNVSITPSKGARPPYPNTSTYPSESQQPPPRSESYPVSYPASSSASSSLPRVNFPTPVPSSFSVSAPNLPAPVSHRSTSRQMTATTTSTSYSHRQFEYPHDQSRPPHHYPPAVPSQRELQRPRPPETDTCRNPFELPAPTGVIQSTPPYKQYNKEQAPSPAYASKPYPGYPSTSSPYQAQLYNESRDRLPVMPNNYQSPSMDMGTKQRPPTVSARFPPVPKSNYDLQRQIYDRMIGNHQAPPKLLEKARAEPPKTAPRPEMPPQQKRESPLDLSVKTVRQSADSTRDDVDVYMSKTYGPDGRLASAPKIDFNPNFSSPLVQTQAMPVSLPPVHSIRQLQPMPMDSPNQRKRPNIEPRMEIPQKITKVDTWKMAMDEQIEERLKAARQNRHPNYYPSVHPSNYQPPKPGWTPAVTPPDPQRIVQQISRGVMPDTKVLQDDDMIQMLRTSLEEKEARLQALQAAASRQQPLPSFDVLNVERMCVPPSYPHGQMSGVEPVKIGVEPTRNYMKGPNAESDVNDYADFLAARIRTKAEMKQMTLPVDDNAMQPQPSGSQTTRGNAPINVLRLPRPNKKQRRNLQSPGSASESCSVPKSIQQRDPHGIRSSSETSVFDFRESDSEGEAATSEGRSGLDGMRRPRKTQPSGEKPAPPPPVLDDDDDILKEEPVCGPLSLWNTACDKFVEHLQKKPVKRSIRRIKPNPKFFADESEAPEFMKVKSEEDDKGALKRASPQQQGSVDEIKVEEEDPLALPTSPKEESSGEDVAPSKTAKSSRKKGGASKQQAEDSGSEWESLDAESGSEGDSESSVSEKSEPRSVAKTTRSGRVRRGSKSEKRSKGRTEVSDSDEYTPEQPKSKGKKTRRIVMSDSGSEENEVTTKGRRTRSRVLLKSDDDSDSKQKRPRTRARAASPSDEEEKKVKRPRTRARAASPSSDEESDSAKKKNSTKKTRARTASTSEDEESDSPKKKSTQNKSRNRAVSPSDNEENESTKKKPTKTRRNILPPARMRLRSKKRASAFRAGWEDDLIKFKQHLRIPDRLLTVSKPKKRPVVAESADEKHGKKTKKERKGDIGLEKKGKENSEKQDKKKHCDKEGVEEQVDQTNVVEEKNSMAEVDPKRQSSEGKKRLKLRRKFRSSGFDYMRKSGKKKQSQRKDCDETSITSDAKKRDRAEITDISAEVKSWVVNKSAGETLLHRAARLAYADVASYCLNKLRLPPSPRDNAGYTPLHEACSRGHVAVAGLLLQHGASVSESARGGVRPLHQAAENNHLELVRLLLAYGADPLLATYTGQTAMTLTTQDNIRELIQLHLADVEGDFAPKWSFKGPASIFDCADAAFPLADIPSPGMAGVEVEIEASEKLLPPVYQLVPSSTEGLSAITQDKWVILEDVVSFLKAKSCHEVLSKLPGAVQNELTPDQFIKQAVPLHVGVSTLTPIGNSIMLRYDEQVRDLLNIEVSRVSLLD